MTKLSPEEKKVYNSYHIPGNSPIHRIKIDCVFFNINNSEIHELAKAKVCWDIKKRGGHFLTEAERNAKDEKENKRRVDIVDLTENVEMEVECDINRAKRFIGDKKVFIVPVGWKKTDPKWLSLVRL